jgi:hypothetical protein
MCIIDQYWLAHDTGRSPASVVALWATAGHRGTRATLGDNSPRHTARRNPRYMYDNRCYGNAPVNRYESPGQGAELFPEG